MSNLHWAYLKTTYWVEALPQPIALRVGEGSRSLDRILAQQRVRRWAFITAWNPRSQVSAPWRNAARQAQLRLALERGGYRWLPALGLGDDSEWAPEPSMLVLGISQRDAARLARRFEQNAIVVGALGGRAALAWIRLIS